MGFAKNSKIHTDFTTLYFSNAAKRKTKQYVLMGHGTKGGESVKTLCHPDGSSRSQESTSQEP